MILFAFDAESSLARRATRWLPHVSRQRLIHSCVSFLAALGIAAATLAVVVAFREAPASRIPPVRIAASEWIDFARPVQLYAIQTKEFGKDVRHYEARQHRDGGGRQDRLVYGPASIGVGSTLGAGPMLDTGPMLDATIYRVGTEAAPPVTFFVEMARRAAQAGYAVTRSTTPGAMASRFGPFEVADLTLAEATTQTACLGFRLAGAGTTVRISGFACNAAHPIELQTLTCALDRIDLLTGGDRDLSKFFVAAEVGRGKACAKNARSAALKGERQNVFSR